MKRTAAVATLLFLLVLISGCSWEIKGTYYPPRTAANTVGIRKVPLVKCSVPDYAMVFSFENEPQQERYRRWLYMGKEFLNRDTGYFTHAVYRGETYYVYMELDWPKLGTVKITPARNKTTTVAKFDPPRRISQIAAFQQQLKGKDYLVVYLGQSDLSNSSTLLIFDENFRIVYQDHLLGALEIGHDADRIVVKSENFWYPKDDKRVDINGDWVYFIP